MKKQGLLVALTLFSIVIWGCAPAAPPAPAPSTGGSTATDTDADHEHAAGDHDHEDGDHDHEDGEMDADGDAGATGAGDDTIEVEETDVELADPTGTEADDTAEPESTDE